MSNGAFQSIIEKYFAKNGGWTRLKGELSVYYWPRIAGAEIAKKVEAIRYRDGILYLQTEVPALAQQILMMIPSFMEKYRKFLGKGVLKGIKVKVGTTTKLPAVAQTPSIRDFSLEDSQISKIEICKKTIEDPELALGFEKLMHKFYLVQKQQIAVSGKVCLACGVAIEAQFDYCPCCEKQVNQEIQDYLQYQKNHHPGPTQSDPTQMDGLSHLKIKNISR